MRSILHIVCSIIAVAAFSMLFFLASSVPVHAATLSHSTAGDARAGDASRVRLQFTDGGCGITITNSKNGASASYYTCLDTTFTSLDGQLTVSFRAHSTPLFASCLVSMSILDDTVGKNVGQQNVPCTSQAKQGLQRQIFHLHVGWGSFDESHLFYVLGYVNYIYNGHLKYGGDAYSHELCLTC